MREAASARTKELLHTGMWTLLGLMGVGLVLVPLLRPSILLTSLFFGWSNVMVAYMAFRIVGDMRNRDAAAAPVAETTVAPPVVRYRYDPQAQEQPRRRIEREPPAVVASEPRA